MEEDLFVVRTLREGTVKTNDNIESILTNMGSVALRSRNLGKVRVVVEKVGGQFTKQKVVFLDTNDQAFNAEHEQNANILLTECIKVVDGNGNDGEFKVIVTSKK